MFFSALASISFLVGSIAASSTPALDARAATTTIHMRIEGPIRTLYEKTIFASAEKTLINNGHTATCEWSRVNPITLLINAFHVRQRYAQDYCWRY